KPGIIHFTAAATSGTLGDAMATTLAVKRAMTPINAAEYGSTVDQPASVPIKVPDNAIVGATRLNITLAPTLIGGLDNAFAVLRDERLRTWEMRLSRAVLASDYLKLKPVLGDAVKWPNADKAVNTALKNAINFQAPNGGMAFWIPRDLFVSPFLSVYTALSFNWLVDAGHEVPERVQSRLQDYLRENILDNNKASQRVAPVLRAAALAALAPTGTLPSGAIKNMRPELPHLRLFGKALLLNAALKINDRTSARSIAQSILSHASESAGAISFNERQSDAYFSLLATPIRSNCAVLDALVNYASTINDGLIGELPQKLMRWIAAAREQSGAWPNSQENVFCTTATVHYAQAYEQPVHDLVATVQAGAKKLGQAQFDSRSTPAQNIKAPPPRSADRRPFKLMIAPQGTGRLYYTVNLTYAVNPADVPAANAGFSLRRAYRVERNGEWQKVEPTTILKRGDMIRVDLYLDVPTTRHHVVLSDPLPGGFQAVNRQLATAMHTTPDRQPGSTVLWFNYGAWPNGSITHSGFYHRETGFDAVRFFADTLRAGHYHLVYTVQAISPGRFIAPAPS
ncbi:MAG: hypothetical protein L0H29_10255, partial [Sinobacteraceae bacterium]|nr:hypothetical protein [Nevskiaceae bacterium]